MRMRQSYLPDGTGHTTAPAGMAGDELSFSYESPVTLVVHAFGTALT
jgi:hypothetical protein